MGVVVAAQRRTYPGQQIVRPFNAEVTLARPARVLALGHDHVVRELAGDPVALHCVFCFNAYPST
eukprot:1334494-Lingulodinium_polyedra.AAC.1